MLLMLNIFGGVTTVLAFYPPQRSVSLYGQYQ